MTALEQLAARLWTVVADDADFPVERLTRTTHLRRDLNLSGVQRIALAYRLEAEFEIVFTDSDYDSIVHPNATVADVLAAVVRHSHAKEITA